MPESIMMQKILENIRVYILGNPIKISEKTTIIDAMVYQLFRNTKFVGVFFVLLLIIATNLILLVTTKSRIRSQFYLYVAGLFLVFSSLNYKYSADIVSTSMHPGTTTHMGSKFVTNGLKNAVYLMQSNLNPFKIQKLSYVNLLKNGFWRHRTTQVDKVENNSDDSKEFGNSSQTTKSNSVERMAKELPNFPNGASGESNDLSNENKALSNGVSTSNHQDKIFKNSESTKDNFGDLDQNLYLKRIVKNLNSEFQANCRLEGFVLEIKSTIENLQKETKKFICDFKPFYSEALKIEGEMASFNAAVTNYSREAKQMVADVFESFKIQGTLKQLASKTKDEGLNMIIAGENLGGMRHSQNGTFTNDSKSTVTFLNAYFCFQAALSIYFLIIIVCEIDLAFVLRFLTFICLASDLLFGLYMLVFTHFLDKTCVIGNVDGCPASFSNGFAEFAATTNIDLKSNGNVEKDKLHTAINLIQKNSEEIIQEFHNFFQNDPTEKFKFRAILFTNLFDKIEFVFDDFENLTHEKVHKKRFFKYIRNMKQNLENIKLNFDHSINRDKLLAVYEREVAFLSFLKNEKDNLFNTIDRQILQGENTAITEKERQCEAKKKKICHSKKVGDYLWASLILGGILFMILVSI